MPKLYSSKDIVRTLEKYQFVLVSQRGSHAKYRKKQGEHILTVIVPMAEKEIPQGTFNSILRQANLNKEDFK